MISSISLSASASINCNRLISNSLHITSQSSNFNEFPVHKKNPHKTCYGFCYSPSPQFSLIVQPPIQNSSPSRHRGCSLVAFDGKSSSSGDQEAGRALETVLKFYSAIKNKNISELSDVIGDECRCVCNFFSFFQPFQGKKQVVDFLSFLIRSLGNNIEFVVKPTWHDGMNVGVAWRLGLALLITSFSEMLMNQMYFYLSTISSIFEEGFSYIFTYKCAEWKNKNVPLGKGFSFYICQIYQGKVFIRNVEMFMEPLLHIEPFRLVRSLKLSI
ncbi:hypothetical protein LWI29_022667 [Acer saccharum]|uniref:Uncharacterized protein n=1 Tax=Acer saccharum TaxID=4024 RepID=A0AA39SFX7_ACESA|nr:hypothetical protein LWI29_022667 [Acer saccharum]